MKRCSTCNRTYEDSSLNFCLADGAPLVEIASEPTLVIPRPTEKKKGRLLLWFGLASLAAAAVVVVLAAILIYKFSRNDDPIGANTQSNRQSASASPIPKPSPTRAAIAADENKSPDPAPTPTIESPDETTPILWETAASGFKGTPGKTYVFECPPDGTARTVWGSDIYTDYSSICTAAVHVGAITLKDGGVVTIEYRPGRSIYGSSIRNDIKSNSMGEHSRSFVILTDDKE